MTTGPRRRVLVLAGNPYFGGITTHVLTIAQVLRDSAGFECRLACLPGRRADNTLMERAASLGLDIREFRMASTFDLRILSRIRRYLAEENISLVHTHDYRSTLIMSFAARRLPVISTWHGAMVAPALRGCLWQWLSLRAMRRHQLVIACSEFARGVLISRGLPAGQTRVIHNAFAPSGMPAGTLSRAQLDIPDDAFVVLYVGRLVPGKGLAHLIEAIEGLDNAVLVLAGDGPLRESLEAGAARRGVTVRFMGRMASAEPCYPLADVVALPSEMEALPMVLIEAAAFGKAAIATRVGGIPEVVKDNETGLLVAHGDVEALRAALAKARDPEWRAATGARAKAHWEARFSLERLRQDLEQAYGHALDGV